MGETIAAADRIETLGKQAIASFLWGLLSLFMPPFALVSLFLGLGVATELKAIGYRGWNFALPGMLLGLFMTLSWMVFGLLLAVEFLG